MITQSTVETKLLKWMQEFVEVPHVGLNGWPPCPYARQARVENNIDIRQGDDPYADCLETIYDDWSKEVIIYWYDQNKISAADFVDDVIHANKILLAKDIVALEDHPDEEEKINGIKMNFGYCPIIVIQQNSKLNSAADQLRKKGYYASWSQEDLDKIVSWRL